MKCERETGTTVVNSDHTTALIQVHFNQSTRNAKPYLLVWHTGIFLKQQEVFNTISKEPHNKSQVYNACKNVLAETMSEKDDLLALLKQNQSMEDGGFLPEVQISSIPCAILATKRQLENIVMCCCQPKSTFGLDATFELGDFHIMLTTYRNPLNE